MKIFIFPVESQGQKFIGILTKHFDQACDGLHTLLSTPSGIPSPLAATPMLEAGVDLRQIQVALGHNYLKIIEIFTCLAEDMPARLNTSLPYGKQAHLTDTNKFRCRSPTDTMQIRI